MAEYSEYNEFNRFPNLDGLEGKLIDHLVKSQSPHADIIWKLLGYGDNVNALAEKSLTTSQRWDLVCRNSGKPSGKRVFLSPFIDDAITDRCACIYIYVAGIDTSDHLKSKVTVAVETVVHVQSACINGDGDALVNQHANPNDSDSEGNLIVLLKSRETTLLKNVLAEFNGLTLDGIGYLQLNSVVASESRVTMPIFNNRSFYGHRTNLVIAMSGVSENNFLGF